MNDISIRKILIEYLKIKHKDHRIYQEKSIGFSVCDVMLVTDRLVGFEIKSDSDNYTRLASQVKSYEEYFDENYIVIGEKHKNQIEKHIPPEWGILLVTQGNISQLRNARKNKKVDRECQLSMLWKIELKNLLTRNGLPLYAAKDKEFIISKIVAAVPGDTLMTQIADELLNRDYSEYGSNLFYKPPTVEEENAAPLGFSAEELIDMLSEKNLSTFTLDKWMAIYQRAILAKDAKEQAVREYEERKSKEKEKIIHRTPYTEIEISLGVPWISAEIVSDFIKEIFKVKPYVPYVYDNITRTYGPGNKERPLVEHEPITGYWYVCKSVGSAGEIFTTYGTKRMNALQILESTLNLREIKIHNGTEYDEIETVAALEKQKAIKEAFKKWIWEDEDRRHEIADAYNRIFGKYEVVSYDGSGLEFADMNPEIRLFDYQKNAVQKIISTPNTLLSFDVGAGKTYIMIAAAMQMRRSGLSRKNLFVVPNNIVGQWERMFCDLYPKAKVLTVEPKSFTPEKRGKVLKQIQKEDYDGIIMAYSSFEMIHLSADYVAKSMENVISELKSRMAKLSWDSHTSSSIGREVEHVRKVICELTQCISESNDEIFFEDLEINTLFVDEAHNFKNIPLRTSMKNLRGINAKGSKKCLEMLEKVHCVQKMNGGRGAIFATGTPLSNSISDTYAMQLYLQHNDLAENNLHRFDNWAKTFAVIDDVCEIDVNATSFRIIKRFTRFHNLPELSRMFSQVSIFYSVKGEGLPELAGYTDEVIEKSLGLDEYMKEIYERTERIREGSVDRKKDNMLKISTDGRKAALSLNLVGREQLYDEYSKVYHCVANVSKIYRENSGCSQIVFCDYSTPKGTSYSVYKEIKERLVENGIPQNEIAFVHSCKSEDEKIKLYDDVNSGRVRVLIGSTFKLGIGANVQTRLKAIHHIDVPWRPADMVQREGRILRRGNENDEIYVFRYVVEGSFDSYSWQILQTKQHFISQFLSGASSVRSIEDLENDELNYAQVKALALSEPLMKAYVEKENDLRNARTVYRQEVAQKERIKREINETELKISAARSELELTGENVEYVRENVSEISEKIPAVSEALSEWQKNNGEEGMVAELCEFSVIASRHKNGKIFLVFSRSGVNYYLEAGNSIAGNKTRISNFFNRFDKQLEAKKYTLDELKRKNLELTEQYEYSSDIVNTIKRLESELRHIFAELSIKQEDLA